MPSFFCFFRWAELKTWRELFQRLNFEYDNGLRSKQSTENEVGDTFLALLVSHLNHLYENDRPAQDQLTEQAFLALMKQLYTEVYVPSVPGYEGRVIFSTIMAKYQLFCGKFNLKFSFNTLAETLFGQAFKSVRLLSEVTKYNNRADTANFIAAFCNSSTMHGQDCATIKKYVYVFYSHTSF